MFPSLMADLIGIQATPDRAIDLAARHGFAGVDLRLASQLEWIEAYGPDRLVGLIHDRSLRPGYASLLTRTLSATEGEWSEAIRRLPNVAAVAQTLGFRRAAVVVLPFDDRLDYAANFRRHCDRLQIATPILADHGIRLGLEYVSPKTRRADAAFPFIHNLAALLELIDEVGHPNVGLMLDTFHWHCARETVADLAALPADRVVVVHVNDAPMDTPFGRLHVRERELPGQTGKIDLKGFMQALNQIGYDGPVTAEPTHDRWPATDDDVAASLTASAVRHAVAVGFAS